MRRSFSKHFYSVIAMSTVAVVVLVSGCSKDITQPPPPASPQVQVIPGGNPAPTTHTSTGQVTIYRMARTKSERKVADANGLVPVTVQIPIDAISPAKDAIRHLIDDPDSPIPSGTRLRKIVIDDNTGLAAVDFSKEFVDNFKGGDTLEAAIIESVRATLGQFSNVNSVQFLVEGKKIAQLGGMQELTDPLPVIRIDSSVASSSATEVR